VQEFVQIFSHKDGKTERQKNSLSRPCTCADKDYKSSVYLSFSNMPVAGYLTLVNEWYFLQKVQLLAKEELSNPERVAYWQSLFEEQFLHPKQGEKHYSTLRGFVIAQLHQQIKNAE
jgi:hypothetical protein